MKCFSLEKTARNLHLSVPKAKVWVGSPVFSDQPFMGPLRDMTLTVRETLIIDVHLVSEFSVGERWARGCTGDGVKEVVAKLQSL